MTNQNRLKRQRKKNKNKDCKKKEPNPFPSSNQKRCGSSGAVRRLALAFDLALLLKEEEKVNEKISFLIRSDELNEDRESKEKIDSPDFESFHQSLKDPIKEKEKEKEKEKKKEDTFQSQSKRQKKTQENTNQKKAYNDFFRLLEREKEIKTWLQKRKKMCKKEKSCCFVPPLFPFPNDALQRSSSEKEGNENQEKSTCSPRCLFWNRSRSNNRTKEISSSAYIKFLEFLEKQTKCHQEEVKDCDEMESHLRKFYIDISITKYYTLHYEFDNFEIQKKEEKIALTNEKREYLLRHTDGRILVMKDAREVVPFAVFLNNKKLPTSRFWLRNQKQQKNKEESEKSESITSFQKNSFVFKSYVTSVQTGKSQNKKAEEVEKRSTSPSSYQSSKEIGAVENTINQIVSTLKKCGIWTAKPKIHED